MKRLFSIIALIATGAALLASCSKNKGGDKDDNTPPTYDINLTFDAAKGSASATIDGAEAGKATANATVTITATAAIGYKFRQWTITEGGDITFTPDATTSPATFTMPAGAVSITAEFAVVDDVYAVITDPTFLAFAKAQDWDTDCDKKLSLAEAAAVTQMNISYDAVGTQIQSLAGIEYFTGLTRLDCNTNALPVLDLSNNSALTWLDCGSNKLTSIDLSKNTALTELGCGNCGLRSIDISGCTELTILLAGYNLLTSLDVSNNTKLTTLECYSPSPDYGLTTLDVSANTALTTLNCSANQLTNLDVSANTALTTLDCYGNRLSTLNASKMADPDNYTLHCGSQRGDSGNRTLQLTLNEGQMTRWTNMPDEYNFNNNVVVTQVSFDVFTAITDPAFLAYAKAQDWDTDGDKKLSLAEAAAVTKIDVSVDPFSEVSGEISSLAGIEHFTGLTVLNCNNNKIQKLDLSKNTELLELNCQSNRLTRFDVSANTKLRGLYCGFNEDLRELDVSNNIELLYLNCVKNNLSTLDLSNNINLSQLFCNNNSLAELNVSACPKLSYISCDSNQLETLDVSKNPRLRQLYCTRNQLEMLDASTMADPENFYLLCGSQTDGKGNDRTLTLYLRGEQLECWSKKQDTNVVLFDSGVYKYILDPVFLAYVKAQGWDTDQDGKLSAAEAAAVKTIRVNNGYNGTKIESLVGIEHFTGLTWLECESNSLTSLDVSKNTALIRLYCRLNSLTSLDVKANTKLEYLDCGHNSLSGLTFDLSKNTALTDLYCNNNPKMGTLNLKANTKLLVLDCSYNGLTTLDVKANTVLLNLDCSYNYLKGVLNISANTGLRYLTCCGIELKTLDVSKHLILKELRCDNNQLPSLNVSNNANLETLNCTYNQLTSLNISNNTLLRYLSCYQNLLGTLDASTMADPDAFCLYCGQQQAIAGDPKPPYRQLTVTLRNEQRTRWVAIVKDVFNPDVSSTFK